MGSPQRNEAVELTIPSRLDFLPLINTFTEEVVDLLRFAVEDRDRIATSVIEAATNAIQHGNREDCRKCVRFRFACSGEGLEITVKDEGEGFKPVEVPDPLAPENLMRETGRGILIMNAFMDQVDFSFENAGGGTTVRLVKRLRKS